MRRREFLGLGALAVLAQDADRLRDPAAAGRFRLPVQPGDNDAVIQALERKLKCTCGCNLDVFTCRTTDFTCTYSPQLHAEVLELFEAGKTPDEIIAAFVAKYGEEALMAPAPVGFNLAGYLVPGLAILAAGTALALVLVMRRKEAASAAAPVGATEDAGVPAPTAEELERLRRALSEVAD